MFAISILAGDGRECQCLQNVTPKNCREGRKEQNTRKAPCSFLKRTDCRTRENRYLRNMQPLRVGFNLFLPIARATVEEFLINDATTFHANRAASARAFVHSLNILIKYARMYGPDHKRTEAQFETTWKELQQGLPTAGEGGFLLGVSDNKLLLDGVPLETGQVERSFGQLLTTAGLASLHFSKDVTINDFTRLVRAFTVAGSKAQDVAKQIKEALGDSKRSTIKINEVKFVAADPLTGDVSVAAQIAAQTLGPE